MTGEPITVLSDDECWELLRSQSLGRIGLSVGDDPDIFPLNYVVNGDKVVFRTGEGTKLFELAVNGKVAFEVDDYDAAGGWSVIVKGTAERLVNMGEINAADELPLKPWVASMKYNYVAITVTAISGRRFVFGPEPQRYPV
ncbi:pyridoxamine 5'-phosphate oxidase family protein [Gordonia amarae]|uniref:Pyridoxamine 5'-phosphate oxidase family protein n=2 Tax=Gordonia amarae TaxID=36821 RepID=A0A857KIM4_9ACTN|nr:pyridoxamine 5'-phosphate oxidase family protein [Gordonia amarae]MCS3878319.1 nitroimidazol reductase NimA-like FMN-containing flavoprotein (pyridoxamine 5'-phosphate oxidase superfamily) [Gordonia amarae]QHN16965.1 pyridoxamine 5'-phosphate oxidase family protein [Gordonia amarae]QHN21491.1 pyridoxamine 5'-phosphate oxidase family protein [Gordonia amarae]QHN30341.1 pyridoxamine 5'-phosphate oxidase family protein [Gordonia amarae]QHN39118.1 pyridoxamine 5'-phosphate oxidase family protei